MTEKSSQNGEMDKVRIVLVWWRRIDLVCNVEDEHLETLEV